MNRNELFIYGEISSVKSEDAVTSLDVREFLNKADKNKPLIVRLNSPGGEIAEGMTIHNMLERFNDNVHVYVDGLAASIASVIAMSGNKVFMARNASLMIHNASTGIMGNSNDLRKTADVLDKMNVTIKNSYTKRKLNVTNEKLIAMMNDETWLTADEALEFGFVDEIVGANKQVASLGDFMKLYNNIPNHLKGGENVEEETVVEPTVEEPTEQPVTREEFDDLLERIVSIENSLKEPEQTTEEEKPEEESDMEVTNSYSRFFF